MGYFRKKLTEAEIEIKKQKKEKLLGFLKTVKEMTPEQLQEFVMNVGITTCEGHMLSGRNQALLMLQAGEVCPAVIGGFHQWKKVNRVVKKGEKSYLSILIPLQAKEKEGEAVELDKIRFKWIPVFSMDQTEESSEINQENENVEMEETVNA